MRATARVVAHAAAGGGTRLAVLRGEPPLLLRHTPSPRPAAAIVYLLGGAAGPLGGDDLRLEIEVQAGAALEIRGVAASMALPGRVAAVSRMTVAARVSGGGELRWLAEPLIAAAGCRHEALSSVDLDEGARLLWREELICGRHGEPPGDTTVAMSLTCGRKPLLRQALRVGPQAPGSAGPGVLAGAKAVGCLVGVGIDPPAPPPRSRNLPGNPRLEGAPTRGLPGKFHDHESAWMELAGSGWMVTAIAAQANQLRLALSPTPLATG